MGRTAIETLLHMMDVAYRSDPFSSLRRNLDSVRDEEWEMRPATWSVEEFGAQPELSVCDIVMHVAGAKHMYADRAFGDCKLEWGSIPLPSPLSRVAVRDWLDEGHQLLSNGLAALQDDSELAVERPAPWRMPMPRQQLLTIMISHDLYHSGEINRQRSLSRGAEGWSRSST